MSNKSARKILVCAVSILVVGANAALAGEITGNGKSLKNPDGTLNGRSACAFSGQEDDPSETGLIAQSWGQIEKAVRDFLATIGLHPGEACNPTKASGEPG
jgi:hypothetical protein